MTEQNRDPEQTQRTQSSQTERPRGDFGGEVRNAANRAEEELQRLIRYMNDEVVPDVRKHSSTALRAAADGLRSLAQKMDDHRS